MTIFEQIVEWNEKKGLLDKGFNKPLEVSFIIEELAEMYGFDSVEGKELAKGLEIHIDSVASTSVADSLYDTDDPEALVDAFADIIVYATGAIRKLGYNPDIALQETIHEINSRTGSKDADGKWVKSATTYSADYSKAKL